MTTEPSLLDRVAKAGGAPALTPATGVLGVWITGLEPRVEQSAALQQILIQALHEHGVLFVRFEGEIEPEDHRRISRIFGELQEGDFNECEIPFVRVIDSAKRTKFGADCWHTDATALARPPKAATLRAIQLPGVGGDTMWASMYAAYEALSSKMQRFLAGLEAVHTTRYHPAAKQGLFKEHISTVHPVVIRDPVSGKPALFVNSSYTHEIVGLSEFESASLLKMLFDHVNTPDFHVRLQWDTQTIAIWEERITQHRAISDYVGRRVLHRTHVIGDALEPYGEIIR